MKLWRGSRTDWGLLLIVIALVVVGLEMVFSASYGFALSHGEAEARQRVYFFRRQAIFALGGLIALLVFWRIDYRLYRRYAVYILVATVVVLLAMAILGRKVQFGRWVFWKQRSVQPVEAAKVGAIIYIAVWLEARGKDLRNITLGLVPFAVLLGVIAGLVAVQPDFSTAVLLVGTATAMFFVAGADVKQLLIGFLVGGVALALVALAAGYRYVRIVDWWRGPLSDPQGGGFQRVQSLVALNRGHWLGVGLGQSEQKYIIYAPHSDCIFAIIGEEFGFLGASAIIILYALWTWRGLRIAFRAPDDYGMLLAVGLVSWVTLQAALHISALTALTPFTGTVLPFVSYGGSSLTSCLASVGILLNISQSRAEEGRQT